MKKKLAKEGGLNAVGRRPTNQRIYISFSQLQKKEMRKTKEDIGTKSTC